jgi:Kdo2-lipid IVA lauroyltransferase/acyltransferase
LRLLAGAVAALPVRASAWLGRRLGDLAYALLVGRRRLALANLLQAFPERSPADRRGIARRSFQHLGMVFTEACFVLGRPLDQVTAQISVEGLEHLRAVVDRHGRALLLTAHLGNWELLALAPVLTGYPLTVVARARSSLGVWADGLRRTAGVEVVDKDDAVRPVLEALRRGRLVGVLLDQNTARREGFFVAFFGRRACTSKAMALLAVRTRTPVVPAFTRRLAPGRHAITIEPALPVPEEADADALAAVTQRCTAAIEAAIRRTPEQWLWVHDRWRTRPPEELDH